MTYPGGKAGGKTPHCIINQIPPHEFYAEVFLGDGAIMRLKRPAACSIGIDSDDDVMKLWAENTIPGLTVRQGNAIEYLTQHAPRLGTEAVIYLDPPYLLATRKSQRNLYRHEFHTIEEHSVLLDAIIGLDCRVLISGYWSRLYMDKLRGWRTISWQAMTRNRPAVEWLWMNYPEPIQLHDYRYLGQNFREREKYKRQQERWRKRLARMPALQRWAMFSVIEELKK